MIILENKTNSCATRMNDALEQSEVAGTSGNGYSKFLRNVFRSQTMFTELAVSQYYTYRLSVNPWS